MGLISGELGEPLTADARLAINGEDLAAAFPDAELCLGPDDGYLPNGPAGRFALYCYTGETQSGESYAAQALFLDGTSNGDTILYEVVLYTTPSSFSGFVDKYAIVRESIVWKLYGG